MTKDPVESVLEYLKHHQLVLTTAESCTAGDMVAMLAAIPGTGEVLESVMWCIRRLQETPARRQPGDHRPLWPDQRSSGLGNGPRRLRDSQANVAIATTGIAGPEGEGSIQPGTLCFAWAFAGEPLATFTVASVFSASVPRSCARARCSA
ncbi:CinA family protein [Pseudomonas bharatica]|uniref:CinA family protein n=1 Tax=Pseudomonas bharatica TaxID=2692112 RepID=UPI004067B8BB